MACGMVATHPVLGPHQGSVKQLGLAHQLRGQLLGAHTVAPQQVAHVLHRLGRVVGGCLRR